MIELKTYGAIEWAEWFLHYWIIMTKHTLSVYLIMSHLSSIPAYYVHVFLFLCCTGSTYGKSLYPHSSTPTDFTTDGKSDFFFAGLFLHSSTSYSLVMWIDLCGAKRMMFHYVSIFEITHCDKYTHREAVVIIYFIQISLPL